MHNLGPTLDSAIAVAKGELAVLDRKAAALKEWIAASERLFEAAGVPSMDAPPAPAAPQRAHPDGQPTSLRSALRAIIDGLTGPVTVAELVEKLEASGLHPKDADSVDSTLYNLKAAGVPVVKVAARTWKRAEEAPASGDTRAA